MPYGLCNAGVTYQRMVDISLSGLPCDRVLAYMDDIVVFSRTFAEHLSTLESVFKRVRASGITLKASKCVIGSDRVDFLGYNLSCSGIKPQKRLTEAIDTYQVPESRKDLKRFLGLAGFYRHFVKDFAHISAPLNKLTSDNVPFVWDRRCEEAFNQLKGALKSEPVLAFPRVGEQFFVEVDGSDCAVGGVLSQIGDDDLLHPVAYFSNALTSSQRNWAAHTIEAFAIVLATRHWYPYLAGTKFTINSDHNPLVHLRNQKDPRGKFARWINELEEFNYCVKYIPGKENIKADALSRNRAASQVPPESEYEDKIFSMILNKNNFRDQLIKEQQNDPIIKSAAVNIVQNTEITTGRLKRVQKQLRVDNGVLTKSGRPVVPPSLRKYVVSEIHNVSHFGVEKTYSLLKTRFFWPNMFEYVSVFIKYCSVCGKTKSDSKPPKAPLLPLYIAEAPMQFVSMDIAHLPVDDDGFRYILLIGDIFSKFIEAIPLRDQSAQTVTNALINGWILKHGSPVYILSDQGSNVDGSIVNEVCNSLGIEKRRTSAYHSQCNGFAERNIRSIRDILRAVLLDRNIAQKNWRKLLPEVVFSLNVTESKSIKCIPYEVVFGRSVLLPQDILFGLEGQIPLRNTNTAAQYAQEVKVGLQNTYDHVTRHLSVSKERMQKQYNKHIRFNDYTIGDKVWVKMKHYKTGESRKLSPRRNGPWTITEILPNGLNFKVVNDSSKSEKIIHHDRLSPAKTESGSMQPSKPTAPSDSGEAIDEGEVMSHSDSSDDDDDTLGGPINSDDDNTDSDTVEPRRYPIRDRAPRHIEGAIPWDAVNL